MKKKDLTKGSVIKSILMIAVPSILTSLLELLYNLTDLFWISRVGVVGIDNVKAIAAVGTASLYIMMALALMNLVRVAFGSFIPKNVARNDEKKVNNYVVNGLYIMLFLAFIYSMIGLLFKEEFIGLYGFDETVSKYAVDYIRILAIFIYFQFFNPIITSVFNGLGRAIVPLIINAIGIFINIVLDPILIVNLELGVKGAAIATVIAQAVVALLYIIILVSKYAPLKIKFNKIDFKYVKDILKVGYPLTVRRVVFTVIGLILGIIISQFGEVGIAVQRIGVQVEAITWRMAGGFGVALAAYVGQNIGAQNHERVKEGYYKTIVIVGIYGLITSLILFFAPEIIINIFNPDEELLRLGVTYLRILSFSQIFMIIEIATQGALNGAGKTMPSAVVGTVFNLFRIPIAIILSKYYGLNGIWIAISITTVFKGVVLYIIWVKALNNKSYLKFKSEVS